MNSSECTTIGEIALVYDGPHATPKKIESGPIFLSISSLDNGSLDLSKSAHISESDFQKWTKRVTPEVGDILFSYETRLGEAALMPPNIRACLGRRMGLLRPNREKVLPEYLLYAYLSPGFQEVIRSKTIHGATVDRIALKELPSFPITIPSLQQQKNIVQQLKTLDRKTNGNKVISSLLEQIAQAIFKSWFVDFEPTKAKIAAREALLAEKPAATAEQIATAEQQAAIHAIAGAGDIIPTEQLQTIADLFPNQMVDSELGEIPEGWLAGTIGDIAKARGGYAFKSKEFKQQGHPVVKIKNITGSGNVDITGCNMIDELSATKAARFILQEGDLLMAMTGATVGKVGLLNTFGKKVYLNQRVAKFESEKFGSDIAWYLYCAFARAELSDLIIGAAQAEFFKVVVRFSRFMLLPELARFPAQDSDLLAL